MKSWLRLSILLILSFGLAFLILSSLPKENTFDDVSNSSAKLSGDMTLENDPEGTKIIDWRLLRSLNPETGDADSALLELDKKMVKIPGFMVPLDDYQASVTEFLLVPSAQACIHVPPPPPNQMIYVKMDSKRETKVAYGAIWVVGELNLSASESPYGKVSFTLKGRGIKAFKMEKRTP